MTRILRSALLAAVLAGAGLVAAHPARADGWHGWHRGDDRGDGWRGDGWRGDGWRGGWRGREGDDDGGWGVVVAPRAYYPPPPVYYAPPPPPPPPVFFTPGISVGIGFR